MCFYEGNLWACQAERVALVIVRYEDQISDKARQNLHTVFLVGDDKSRYRTGFQKPLVIGVDVYAVIFKFRIIIRKRYQSADLSLQRFQIAFDVLNTSVAVRVNFKYLQFCTPSCVSLLCSLLPHITMIGSI